MSIIPPVAPPAALAPKPPVTIAPRTIVDVAVLALLAVIGMIGFASAYESVGWVRAGLIGIAIGIGLAILSHILRLGAIPTFVLALIGFYLFGSAAALPNDSILGFIPTFDSLVGLSVGAVFGWADILTLRAPVELPDYVTTIPYLAGWAVAFVATLLAVRWLPGRRRTAWRSALILLGPVVLYFAGVLFGTDEPFFAALRGVTFAAVALLWIGWRRGAPSVAASKTDTGILRRKILGSAIVVTAAVLVGVFAGAALAPLPDNRFVLREEIEPPFEPLTYPSPFQAYRNYTKNLEETKLFTVSGLEEGDRIRLATLDTYDGVLWGVAGSEVASEGSGAFSLVGRSIPVPALLTPADEGRELDVTVEGYADVWIPSIGYATTIGFDGATARDQAERLRYNPATGTAVLTGGLEEGDEYTLEAVRQQEYETERLLDVPVASMQLPPVSNIPDVVSAKAAEYSAGETTPIEQLRAIESVLQTTGFLSHGAADDAVASRSGQGADRMVELFTRSQLIGDEEQYASAFALMARSMNFPARVVMGFAPEVAEGQDEVTVLGADVTAWVEVAFEGVGWVPFYPTPDETDIPQDENPKPQSEPQPQVRQPPRTDSDENDLVAGVEVDDSDSDDDPLFDIPAWAIAIALALAIPAALIFIPMLLVALIKGRRAARRRRVGGDRAVAGAWEELVDRYTELGYTVPRTTTRMLTAAEIEEQVEQEPGRVRTIAWRADEAVFSGREVPAEDVDQVWTEAMAVSAAATAGLGWWRRTLARYRLSSVSSLVSRVTAAADAVRRKDKP